jgi:protein SCO1/2
MKATQVFWLMVLFVPMVLVGCTSSEPKPADRAAVKEYSVKGKVVALEPEKPALKLDHEDIPGLMKAMQMEFRVQDAKLLEGLRPGDEVQGKLRVESGSYIITQLEKH